MKVLFFDIDGTLVKFDGNMPESAHLALTRAREKGHKLFLCSGRPRCMIDEQLMQHGFDGMICSAGAYIEYQGEVIYHRVQTPEQLKKMVDYFEEHHFLYNMQCAGRTVYTRYNLQKITENLNQKMNVDPERQKAFLESVVLEEDTLSLRDVEKAMYFESDVPVAEVEKALRPDFDVTVTSFQEATQANGEVTLAGITKSFGMKMVLNYFGADVKDSVAFGDGDNDVDMIAYAAMGVAMGNACDRVKAVADYITDNVEDDGLYHAMIHLGLA